MAYEYLKKHHCHHDATDYENKRYECMSVTLSSTPTSVALVENEAQRLIEELTMEDAAVVDYEEDDAKKTAGERFHAQHVCRTAEIPAPLLNARAHAGTVWRGTTAVADYVATAPGEEEKELPPALVIRGEYDFVTEDCVVGWKKDVGGNPRAKRRCRHILLLCRLWGWQRNGSREEETQRLP